ncbi:nuclear transport factor 2 family protein [Microbulbifer guangxiensis]|uniref:nuclear transport factor 2 family protein n=1 Tax=Microbulbifer guangxiensis TaxID=2904249 RepID=UPI001F4243E0|nr:nuclear transport factor 2 family protein [Microbulbifer guangxiensis]
MSGLIAELQQYYSDFGAVAGDPGLLDRLYDEGVTFCDPVHRVEGLPALKRYFAGMSEGLTSCRFEFDDAVLGNGNACLPWQMHYTHRQLNRGQPLILRGCSLLQFRERVYYHEDFYDLGAMVYEHVPLLGSVVRGVKKRLGGAGS